MNPRLALFAVLFTISSATLAQAPRDATGECKDGTFTTSPSKRGACAGHHGVKEWYSSTAAAGSRDEHRDKMAKPATQSREQHEDKASGRAAESRDEHRDKAAEAASDRSARNERERATERPRSTAATGGGDGKVWVNKNTKVYHCQGDEWYGKTKQGEYLSEREARQQGFRAARGKECS